MIHENQVFVVNVVIINLTQKTMIANVISRPTCVIMKLNTIMKIHKYGGFHKGHHFIPMAMEVQDTPKCDMNHFIRKCAHFFPQ